MVSEGRCRDAHIVLTGPMGSGKTTVGRLLARSLERPFYDSDAQLEAEYGSSSRTLAREHGVDWLHRAEATALREALEQADPSVVAAAASIGDLEHVGRLLAERVVSVLLVGEADVLARRAEEGTHRRPVSIEQYRSLASRRHALLVAHVDFVVDVTALSPSGVIDAILAFCLEHSTTAQESQAESAD